MTMTIISDNNNNGDDDGDYGTMVTIAEVITGGCRYLLCCDSLPIYMQTLTKQGHVDK